MKDLNLKKIQPTAGYVLVEPAKAEEKTVSGIILPENESEKPQYGVVLAIGGAIYDDAKEITSPAQVGDKVIYKKWGGNEFKINDVEYQFLKFEDILAIIK